MIRISTDETNEKVKFIFTFENNIEASIIILTLASPRVEIRKKTRSNEKYYDDIR